MSKYDIYNVWPTKLWLRVYVHNHGSFPAKLFTVFTKTFKGSKKRRWQVCWLAAALGFFLAKYNKLTGFILDLYLIYIGFPVDLFYCSELFIP